MSNFQARHSDLRFEQINLYFELLIQLSAGGNPDGKIKRPPVHGGCFYFV
jgi:hypothetical protein